MKKSIIVMLILTLLLGTCSVAYAKGQYDLGKGWSMDVHKPHTGSDTGQWHVHVYQGNAKKGSIGVNGSASHNDKLDDVPKSIKKKAEDHPEFKKAKDKQEAIEEEGKENAEKATEGWTKKNKKAIQDACDAGAKTALIAGVIILVGWLAKIANALKWVIFFI